MEWARMYSYCHFYWCDENKAIHVEDRKHSNPTYGYKIKRKNLLSLVSVATVAVSCVGPGLWLPFSTRGISRPTIASTVMGVSPLIYLYCWLIGCLGGEWGKLTCIVCPLEEKLHHCYFIISESWTQKEWTLCQMTVIRWSWKLEFWSSVEEHSTRMFSPSLDLYTASSPQFLSEEFNTAEQECRQSLFDHVPQ